VTYPGSTVGWSYTGSAMDVEPRGASDAQSWAVASDPVDLEAARAVFRTHSIGILGLA
jgi:hypothetical protein